MNTNEEIFYENRRNNITHIQSIPLRRMPYNREARNYQQYQAFPPQRPRYETRILQFPQQTIHSQYSQQPQPPMWEQNNMRSQYSQNMQYSQQPQTPMWGQNNVHSQYSQNMQYSQQPQSPMWNQANVLTQNEQTFQTQNRRERPSSTMYYAYGYPGNYNSSTYGYDNSNSTNKRAPKRYNTTNKSRIIMKKVVMALEVARKAVRIAREVVKSHIANGKQINKKIVNEKLQQFFKVLGVSTLIGTIGYVAINGGIKVEPDKKYPLYNGPADVQKNIEDKSAMVTGDVVIIDGNGDIYQNVVQTNETKSILTEASQTELQIPHNNSDSDIIKNSEYVTDNKQTEEKNVVKEKVNDESVSYWLDKLSPELIEDLANAIRAGNKNIPNEVYATYKVYEKESDYELVKEYFERLDSAKWNFNKTNSVVYQAPDVLLAIIKYYYAKIKEVDKNAVVIYYEDTQGVVNIATVQKRREGKKPKIYHTADKRNKRQSNIDDIILAYATLENIAGADKKITFIEMPENGIVSSKMYIMISSVPKLLEQIVENDRNQEYKER